jgi:hypothetical protein
MLVRIRRDEQQLVYRLRSRSRSLLLLLELPGRAVGASWPALQLMVHTGNHVHRCHHCAGCRLAIASDLTCAHQFKFGPRLVHSIGAYLRHDRSFAFSLCWRQSRSHTCDIVWRSLDLISPLQLIFKRPFYDGLIDTPETTAVLKLHASSETSSSQSPSSQSQLSHQ